MADPTTGIHHVTAICGAPQVNIDFYAGILGMRLVKRTVNFDDPGSYHLYYGDRRGRPGSLVTFFPWPYARPGRAGAGSVGTIALAGQPGSVEFWMDRLAHLAYEFVAPTTRFGESVLPLHDPDGMRLEIVERARAGEPSGGEEGPDAQERRLRAICGVTLLLREREATAEVLRDLLGYRDSGEDDGHLRMVAAGGEEYVDLLQTSEAARPGMGAIHHVAYRAVDGAHQAELAARASEMGLHPTDVKDRKYFRSIYFREPGGVLFEIATDGPGMATDEDAARLGERLALPEWLEPRRADIEMRLPEIAVPR